MAQRQYIGKLEDEYTTNYQNNLNKVVGIKEQINLSDKQRFDYQQMYLGLLDREESKVNKINLFKQKMLGGDGFKGELEIFAMKNPKFKDSDALNGIIKGVEELNDKLPDATNKSKQLEAQFGSLKKEAAQSGSLLARTADNAFKFLRFYLIGQQIVNLKKCHPRWG